MKKKLIMCLTAVCCTIFPLVSQNVPKCGHYLIGSNSTEPDYSLLLDGGSYAEYIGTTREFNPSDVVTSLRQERDSSSFYSLNDYGIGISEEEHNSIYQALVVLKGFGLYGYRDFSDVFLDGEIYAVTTCSSETVERNGTRWNLGNAVTKVYMVVIKGEGWEARRVGVWLCPVLCKHRLIHTLSTDISLDTDVKATAFYAGDTATAILEEIVITERQRLIDAGFAEPEFVQVDGWIFSKEEKEAIMSALRKYPEARHPQFGLYYTVLVEGAENDRFYFVVAHIVRNDSNSQQYVLLSGITLFVKDY